MKQCDKQCLTKLINGDISKCNYYSNNRCLIDEYRDNYLFKGGNSHEIFKIQ